MTTTLRTVVANRVRKGLSGENRRTSPEAAAPWIAARVDEWLRGAVGDFLRDGQKALARARASVQELGGWKEPRLIDVMEELTHASDALEDIATVLGSGAAIPRSGPAR